VAEGEAAFKDRDSLPIQIVTANLSWPILRRGI
jgi:hypothetical protein